MELETIVGYLAATLTTVSFVPQAYKVIRTRDTESISLVMYILFSGGVAMWLLYGIVLTNFPIILANSITLSLSLVILYFKITQRKG